MYSLTFNSLGQIVQETIFSRQTVDEQGNSTLTQTFTTFVYNSVGQVVQETTAINRENEPNIIEFHEIQYDEFGRIAYRSDVTRSGIGATNSRLTIFNPEFSVFYDGLGQRMVLCPIDKFLPNPAPTADFTFLRSGSTIIFNGQGDSDGDGFGSAGNIVSYAWHIVTSAGIVHDGVCPSADAQCDSANPAIFNFAAGIEGSALRGTATLTVTAADGQAASLTRSYR